MSSAESQSVRIAEWAVVRLGTAALEDLDSLAMRTALSRLHELELLRSENVALRAELTDFLFSMITGCADRPLRRELLAIRRAVHNRRRLPRVELAPESVRMFLDRLMRHEVVLTSTAALYAEAVAADEVAASSLLKQAFAPETTLGQALLLANRRLCERLFHRDDDTRTRRRRDETLFRYLSRAAMRTAPFSGFTSFGFVCLNTTRSRTTPSNNRKARSVVHLAAEVIGPWLRRMVAELGARRPVRITPMHADLGRAVVFVDFPCSREGPSTWSIVTVEAVNVVRPVIDIAYPASLADLVRSLERTHPSVNWLSVLADLADAGLVRDEVPGASCAVDDGRPLGSQIGVVAAERLHRAVALGHEWVDDSQHRRVEVLEILAEMLDAHSISALRHDLVDDDPALANLLPDEAQLREELVPLCRLARASATDVPHRTLVSVFQAAYSDDDSVPLPEFLLRVLTIDGIEMRLRYSVEPPAWFGTSLHAFVQQADGEVATCPPNLFHGLPGVSGDLSICMFLQLETQESDAVAAGQYILACNAIQSGRGKYLSRYLSSDPPPTTLHRLRARLRGYRPPLIELAPSLDSNIQLHPPMADWSLILPGEEPPPGQNHLNLDEITVCLDRGGTYLRLNVSKLGHDIQFVHLGFVRDCLLPTPLLAIRALSPSIREDTIAERCLIYDVLDLADVQAGREPRRSRPRLTIGRLILERRRWVLPLEEIGILGESSVADQWRDLRCYFARQQLPERCWVRILRERAGWTEATPLFIDLRTPYAPAALDRLRRRVGPGRNWWVFAEAISGDGPPRGRDGRRHAFEMVIDVDC